jgi:hypothetical protein
MRKPSLDSSKWRTHTGHCTQCQIRGLQAPSEIVHVASNYKVKATIEYTMQMVIQYSLSLSLRGPRLCREALLSKALESPAILMNRNKVVE